MQIELYSKLNSMGDLDTRLYGVKLQLDGATVYCCTSRKTAENFRRAFNALIALFGDDMPSESYVMEYLEMFTYTSKGAA